MALAGFLGSIPLANWLIGNVGQCITDGPCLVPVGFGLMAPSGVFAIGLALVCRDAVHEAFGWRWAMVAVVAGAALSWMISPAVALASGAAFLLAGDGRSARLHAVARETLGLGGAAQRSGRRIR